MILRLRARLADDSGVSLAELMVYAVLSVVILLIVSNIMISSFRTRDKVTDLTTATSVGQLIANSVEEGVRNAAGPPGSTDALQKVGVKAEPVTATGQLLRARVAVGASAGTVAWQCQAWFYSFDTESVYATTNTADVVVDPVSFSLVNGNHIAAAGSDTWILLGEGITLDADHSQFFGTSSSSPTQAKVQLYFRVTLNNTELVLIPTTVVNRKLEASGTGPSSCY